MALAFVFPGQGSQSEGMLSQLIGSHEIINTTFVAASEVLGFDLWDIVKNNPENKLNQTEFTQPALLASSVALWRVWQEHNCQDIAMMAGHSLGEYSALCCAGAMAFDDAIRLVHLRGQLMQRSVPVGTGSMAAILGLDDAAVVNLCRDATDGETSAEAANFNTPGQVVIAGHVAAVDRAIMLATERGAKKAMKLAVSVPSHCSLMKTAADELADALSVIEVQSPSIPVINNVDVVAANTGASIKDALVRQLYCPVRWTQTVEYMQEQQVDSFVECGPGKVLAGLIKRINRRAPVINIESCNGFTNE